MVTTRTVVLRMPLGNFGGNIVETATYGIVVSETARRNVKVCLLVSLLWLVQMVYFIGFLSA